MRRRIITLAVLAAVLSTTLFGIPLAVAAGQYFLDTERREIERTAEAAAVLLAPELARGVTPTDVTQTSSEITVGLYSAQGLRLAGAGPDQAEAVITHAAEVGQVSTDSDTGGLLVVAVPITDGSAVDGVVRAANDYQEVTWQIVGACAAMLALQGAAIAITYLNARRQASQLAAPLESLATAAQQLGDGDFTVRTSVSGIPEIDAAGSSLDATAQRLDVLLGRERGFSSHASHQLRTPLTALRLSLEAAIDAPGEVREGRLRDAIAGADRLERTITDLLALSRDQGSPGAALNVAAVAREALDVVAPLLAARGRSVELVAEDDLPEVRVVGAAVRQVLGVLLDNAVVHGAGRVTVVVRDAGGPLAIDVMDEGRGPGEPDGLLTRPRAASRDGHGIGLTLAREIAEAQGGRLVLRRAAPPIFSILLPGSDPVG